MKKIMPYLSLVLLIALHLPAVQAGTVAEALTSPTRLASDLERDKRSHPAEILALLNLQSGDRVVDIFAGAGYYSEIIAQVVSPDGEVLMQNNNAYIAYVAKPLERRFEGRVVTGVKRHDREADNLDLGESNLDAAMIVMSYHDLYHTAKDWPAIDVSNFLGQIVRALKPGGRFLVVDHAAATGTGKSSAQELHRIEESFARTDIESYGLTFKASSNVLRNPSDDHSLMVFDPAIQGKTDRFVLVFEKPR